MKMFSFTLLLLLQCFVNTYSIPSHSKISYIHSNQLNNYYFNSGLSSRSYGYRYQLNSILKDWVDQQVKENIIKSDDIKKIKLNYDSDSKRVTIQAAMPIKKDETIISLPYTVAIDSTTVQSILGLKSTSFRTGEYGLLALFLINEKLSGNKDSKYFNYINSLDEVPPGVFGWNEDYINEFSKIFSIDKYLYSLLS